MCHILFLPDNLFKHKLISKCQLFYFFNEIFKKEGFQLYFPTKSKLKIKQNKLKRAMERE